MGVFRCSAGVVAVALGTLSGPVAESPRLPPSVERAIVDITAGELRAHVETLASDEMGGRGVGQSGNQQAARYVADVLARAGVASAAPAYLLPVELTRASLRSDGRLTVTSARGDALAELTPGPDFYALPESGDAAVTGPLVHAAHGVSAPAWHHDDYAGRRVRDAIVFVEDGIPPALERRNDLADGEREALASLDRKVADARARGARGLILIRPALPEMRFVWNETASARDASYQVSIPGAAPLAVATVSSAAAAPIRRELRRGAALTATLQPGIALQRTIVHNVVGVLEPGSSSGEMVVVGAHLDHDGTDEEGRIFNGADDNASGTAAVLAMAAALTRAASDERPRRRIVFALWNAEEKGSLGVEAYLAAPVPAARIVANLNLDMVGRREEVPDGNDPRWRGFRPTSEAQSANVLHVLGYSYAPDLAALVRRANGAVGLRIKEEYDRGAQDLLKRSDHWPFLTRGIPALFLTTGLHPDYHTPDDDADRIDFTKLERITELASRVAWLVASGEPPRFRRPPPRQR